VSLVVGYAAAGGGAQRGLEQWVHLGGQVQGVGHFGRVGHLHLDRADDLVGRQVARLGAPVGLNTRPPMLHAGPAGLTPGDGSQVEVHGCDCPGGGAQQIVGGVAPHRAGGGGRRAGAEGVGDRPGGIGVPPGEGGHGGQPRDRSAQRAR
jgi:hypothetical protein